MNINDSNLKILKIIYISLKALLVITLIIFLFLIFTHWNKGLNIFPALTFLSYAIALLAFGGAIGFLFGLPKSNNIKLLDKEGKELNSTYSDNTNLEQVSDWLSKTIIGLTLVKLNTIFGWIHIGATTLEKGIIRESSSMYAFSYGVIIFYFIAGLAILYIWTKIEFIKVLESSRNELRDILKNHGTLVKVTTALNSDVSQLPDGIRSASGIIEPNKSDEIIRIENFLEEAKKQDYERPVNDKLDWQKGRWGGKSIHDGNSLKANVIPIPNDDYFFEVNLTVEKSKNNNSKYVAYFLHDTFVNRVIIREINNDNRCELNIKAYGAFTVGVIFEDIKIDLELDLAQISSAPEIFKSR